MAAKTTQRQNQLEQLKNHSETLIFYEAPHRIVDCLQDIQHVFGTQRAVGFAREITKTFETIVQKPVGELLQWVKNDHHQQKGEIVLVVAGNTVQQDNEQEKTDELLKRLLQDLSVKSAAQLAADLTGLKKNMLYQRALILAENPS